jgi:hypothetical protein
MLPFLLQLAAPLGAQPAASSNRAADDYTLHELLQPGSGAFRILSDVTAASPGARPSSTQSESER